MIIKDRHPADHPPTDMFTAAGAKAEDQMAFYLKRAFGDDKEVMVLNDLRLANDKGDDHAQIDHLVFYRRGMLIIESKSVTSEVKINSHGEWSRLWDGSWQGMESPVHQAKRQVAFLLALLRAHAEELRGKMAVLGLQLRFGACPFDVLVAISDKGSIDRSGGKFPEVFKAEAVVDAVKAIIAKHRLGFLTPSFDTSIGSEKFTDEEMARIKDFLLGRHTPVNRPAPPKVAVSPKPIVPPKPVLAPKPVVPPVIKPALTPSAPTPAVIQIAATRVFETPSVGTLAPAASAGVPAKSCRKCKGTTLNVEYGRSYYLKCRDCDGDTPINLTCACGQRARVRKEKERFFQECGACGASVLFHVNT